MTQEPAGRRALWLLGLGTLAGAALIAFVASLPEPPPDDVDAITTRLYWLIATLFVLAVPLVVGCAVLWQIGQRAVDTGRFPPSGTATPGVRPAVAGPEAVRRGRLLQIVATLTGAGAVLLPGVVWYLVRTAQTVH